MMPVSSRGRPRGISPVSGVVALLGLTSVGACRPPPTLMDFAGTTIPDVYTPKASRPRPTAESDPRALGLPAVVHSLAGPRPAFELFVARLDEPLASDLGPVPSSGALASLTDVIALAEYARSGTPAPAGFAPATLFDTGTSLDVLDLDNHCESRAHIVGGLVRNQGWVGGKVFANGTLRNPNNNKSWSYHVAAYVLVTPTGGTAPDLRVIDPGFADATAPTPATQAGVFTLDEWISKFVTGRTPKVAIEVTRNAQLYPTTTKKGADYSPVESFADSCAEAAEGALDGYKTVTSYSWCR